MSGGTSVDFGIQTILHNLGDKFFNRVAEDLDLSLKKVRNQQDKLILHQKCVRSIQMVESA
jgi:hypothetical protein